MVSVREPTYKIIFCLYNLPTHGFGYETTSYIIFFYTDNFHIQYNARHYKHLRSLNERALVFIFTDHEITMLNMHFIKIYVPER